MSLKDAYRKKIEAQVEEQVARLAVLKARAKQALADGQILAYEELADAETKLTALKSKLKDLGAASEGAWETMKSGVDQARRDLSDSCRKAADKFRTNRKP
jgi:chromosome segregation ATPase